MTRHASGVSTSRDAPSSLVTLPTCVGSLGDGPKPTLQHTQAIWSSKGCYGRRADDRAAI